MQPFHGSICFVGDGRREDGRQGSRFEERACGVVDLHFMLLLRTQLTTSWKSYSTLRRLDTTFGESLLG